MKPGKTERKRAKLAAQGKAAPPPSAETIKRQKLAAEWAQIQAKNSRPLERGLVASKGKGASVAQERPQERARPVAALFAPKPKPPAPTGSDFDKVRGSTTAKQAPVYSGEAIGIGQMHKSNATLVYDRKTAEEIARMRR